MVPGTPRPLRPPGSPARSPVPAPLSLTTVAQPSPGAVACAPCAPSPAAPRLVTSLQRALCSRSLASRPLSFLLPPPCPGFAHKDLGKSKTPQTFCFCPARAPPRARGSPRGEAGRLAAPRRAATSGDGAAAPAHPSRRTLVFRVDLPHQRDVSLQIKRQRLDGVQVVLHVVHQVDLLPVGRAQHGSPRSPATPRGFPLPPAPAPSEPGAAKCKAPARRRAPPPTPAGPAPLHLRAAPPGPGDRLLAGRAGARRPRARGGHGRACGRAPRRRGRGRGRASAGRGARRPPRRTCPTWKTQIPVSNTWETFGPPAPRMRPGATAPSPGGPAPAARTPLVSPAARGWGSVCHSGPGGGSRGQRAAGGEQTLLGVSHLQAERRRAAPHSHWSVGGCRRAAVGPAPDYRR